MALAPTCSEHPKGRVRRNGYYGKRKQFVRWQCVPDNGARPHMLRPELSSKLVGGRGGCCLECERGWADTDGMPTGTRDRFTLRDKAATLVRLAQGASFREASEFARKRGGYARRRRGGALIASRDGRLARDWVSQYAPILAEHCLPRSWPRTLVIDKLPVHVRDTSSHTPRQSGRASFFVFAALSFVDGRSVLWRVGVSRRADQAAWQRFFAQLPGRPTFITADRDQAMLNAIAATWPDAKVYPCAHHLREDVEAILKEGGLYDRRRRIVQALDEHTFVDPEAYVAFRRIATSPPTSPRLRRSRSRRSRGWVGGSPPARTRSCVRSMRSTGRRRQARSNDRCAR